MSLYDEIVHDLMSRDLGKSNSVAPDKPLDYKHEWRLRQCRSTGRGKGRGHRGSYSKSPIRTGDGHKLNRQQRELPGLT
jgi:hypothetical protein